MPSNTTLSDYLFKEISRIPEIIKKHLVAKATYVLDRNALGVATGAGDSFVVAEAIQYLSNHRIIALDPFELRTNPPWMDRGTLVAISVKGRTVEVVKSAKYLKSRGWRVIGVTANPKSLLGQVSDKVARILYAGGSVPVGVGNFVSALLATSTLIGYDISNLNIDTIMRFESSHELAYELAESSDVLVIGDGITNVSADFICLKLYEVMCKPCRRFTVEQFLHAPIYSVNEKSLVIAYGNSSRIESAVDLLRDAGLKVHHFRTSGVDPLTEVISYVVSSINSLAIAAKSLGLREPCFMTRHALLRLSTPVIYSVDECE